MYPILVPSKIEDNFKLILLLFYYTENMTGKNNR